MKGDISPLKAQYPWPSASPGIRFDHHGWFGWCHCLMLRTVLPKDTKLVLELGSWLGRSTRYFLNACPRADVIAVDHWGRSELIANDDPTCEGKMHNLYDRFLSNCWGFKSRLVPIRATTVAGMQTVKAHGLVPDVIYIDANHTYEDMRQDINMAFSLFPEARLCGDDYGGKWTGLKQAVDEFCRGNSCKLLNVEHAWAIFKADEKVPEVSLASLAKAMHKANINPQKGR